ncbi:histidine phosphatase family protein [Mycobacterium sp. NBC_00419]|uniref:histidine phosphatase family protein n=1 Tax=Mycobacterium sp. NBC_00419 TaxID=2975989 RepID=UPI002E1ABDE4
MSAVRVWPTSQPSRWLQRLAIVVLAVVMFIASSAVAWAATSMTLTFVRHAQSMENVEQILGSIPPGPDLSPLGQTQAQALKDTLIAKGVDYDAIYTSTLIRTSQTAAPYAQYAGLTPVALNGLLEVRAGANELASTVTTPDGKFVDPRMTSYVNVQDQWRLGSWLTPMPQSPTPTLANGDVNGIAFYDRTNAAIQKIYWDEMNKYSSFTADALNPDANPLAFSHNGTITSWVMLNVKNPPTLDFVNNNFLGNTGIVVVRGNPTDGWTLVSWNGVAVPEHPALGTALFVDYRDWALAGSRAVYDVQLALATGDAGLVLQKTVEAVGAVIKATAVLPGKVLGDVGYAIVDAIRPQAPAAAPAAVETAGARLTSVRTAGAAKVRGASVVPIKPRTAAASGSSRSTTDAGSPTASRSTAKSVASTGRPARSDRVRPAA